MTSAWSEDNNHASIKFHGNKNRVAEENHFVHAVLGNYPRLCRLRDGSLLLGYSAPRRGHRALTVVRSTDDGRSFKSHGVVGRAVGDYDNMFLLELPSDGKEPPIVLAAFRNHDLDSRGSHTYFRITVCQSSDGGRNWEFLSHVYEKTAPFGLWEPFMRLTEQGELQLYFSQELAPEDQDTMKVISLDQGRTWTPPTCVTGMGERLRDGMVGIAETKDNGRAALVMVFETTRYGTFSIECVISYDDGATFGCRQPVFTPSKGSNAGSPQIAAFADGSLAVTFMTDGDSGLQGWPANAAVKAVFTLPPRKGQLQWSQAYHVHVAASFWPGLLRIGDDTALAVFEYAGGIRGRLLISG